LFIGGGKKVEKNEKGTKKEGHVKPEGVKAQSYRMAKRNDIVVVVGDIEVEN